MILTSRDTFGGYRIEFCSQNEDEIKLLKKIEVKWHKEEEKKFNKLIGEDLK